MTNTVRWGKLCDKWHDEGHIFHLLKGDGSPACGVQYYTSSGPPPADCPIQPRCRRCDAMVVLKKGDYYVTSFCNHAHRVKNGYPIDHECYVLHPKKLRLEIEGNLSAIKGSMRTGRVVRGRPALFLEETSSE